MQIMYLLCINEFKTNKLKFKTMKRKIDFIIMCVVLSWLICCGAIVANGQTVVKVDSLGNYTSVSKSVTSGSKAKLTGKSFTDKNGIKYPVYISVNGKLFYRKVAKSGNVYNVYLTISK